MELIILLIFGSTILTTGQAFADTTNVKAYGEINFGESLSTVERKIEQDEGIRLFASKWDDKVWARTGINEERYNVNFYFFEDQLYRVRIGSPDRTADKFDSIVKDFRNTLVDLIKSQYGSPSLTQQVSFWNIKPGYITWSHVWKAEDLPQNKEIKVGLSEYKVAEYQAVMYIDYPPLREAKKQAEEKEKEKSIEEEGEKF